jgi:hypothetical protein
MSNRIRELNDAYRCQGKGNGRTMLTRSIVGKGTAFEIAVLIAVRQFNAFTPGNDPMGEHDFGCIEVCGCKVYWKIDYYDLDLEYGSDDPADETKTCRVLTIMLAQDY